MHKKSQNLEISNFNTYFPMETGVPTLQWFLCWFCITFFHSMQLFCK